MVLLVRLMHLSNSFCMLAWPLQVISDLYIKVELTMASCGRRADVGGTPCWDAIEVSLLSAIPAAPDRGVVIQVFGSMGLPHASDPLS